MQKIAQNQTKNYAKHTYNRESNRVSNFLDLKFRQIFLTTFYNRIDFNYYFKNKLKKVYLIKAFLLDTDMIIHSYITYNLNNLNKKNT